MVTTGDKAKASLRYLPEVVYKEAGVLSKILAQVGRIPINCLGLTDPSSLIPVDRADQNCSLRLWIGSGVCDQGRAGTSGRRRREEETSRRLGVGREARSPPSPTDSTTTVHHHTALHS